jgi:hypothetical protein
MSQFVVAETTVSDPEVIVEALVELGIDRDHIEVHEIPVEMTGYSSSDVRMAEIIVRKQHVEAIYGDVGATRYNDQGEKGQYFHFIVDDLDCKNQNSEGLCSGRVDRRWGTEAGGLANHLKARAGAIQVERVARRRGFKNIRRNYVRDDAGRINQIHVTAS